MQEGDVGGMLRMHQESVRKSLNDTFSSVTDGYCFSRPQNSYRPAGGTRSESWPLMRVLMRIHLNSLEERQEKIVGYDVKHFQASTLYYPILSIVGLYWDNGKMETSTMGYRMPAAQHLST